ncbi:MAG: hypothetical protein K5662_04835 [Lachnospiraceae bacterium]|nr:hypothetical protein [Lachnospiraceae bacterium]
MEIEVNDHYEFLVPVAQNKKFAVLRVLLWIVFVIGCFGAIFAALGIAVGLIFALVAVASGYGAYFCGKWVDIEYEYTLVEKELDVDVVFRKESRKHLETIDLLKMEIFAPEKSSALDMYRNRDVKVVDYSSRKPENEDKRYVLYYDGSTKYILEPEERLIKAFYNIAPRKVFDK